MLGGRYLNLMCWRRHYCSTQSSSFILRLAIIAFMWMISIIVYDINFNNGRTWPFLSLFPTINVLESESLWCIVNLISTWSAMFYTMIGSKYTLHSLRILVMMFTLTSYLILLSLNFRGYSSKKGARYRRVNSSLWTRRRVYWLQKGKSRSSYLFDARMSSIKAKAYREKKQHGRNEGIP